jgi:glycosyltransferase involved in cell wall biosynthesis
VTPAVSIVLPVCNQADYITRVVEEYRCILRRSTASFEILLVVNGSVDASEQCSSALAKRFPDVRSFVSDPPGWGRAVRVGLQGAKGDLLCYTNCARTGAEDLSRMVLAALEAPSRVIKANRHPHHAPLRRLGSFLYNLEVRLLFGLSIPDVNGTPKIFPRRFHALLALERDDDLIDLEFCLVCRQQGYVVEPFQIDARRRQGGRSTTGLRTAVRLYRGAWAMRGGVRR